MSVWQAARATDATLTRTVIGAILASHGTQRRLVSDKTGIYPRHCRKCTPIDPDGEMVTRFDVFTIAIAKASDCAMAHSETKSHS